VLSPKQLDVVVAMHANPEKTHKELAPMLLITEGSLKVYLSRIYLALGCNTSRALVLLWERRLRGVPGSVVSTVATVEAGKSAVQ
jgi:DNA-binding CsgD family transcriptional regulator